MKNSFDSLFLANVVCFPPGFYLLKRYHVWLFIVRKEGFRMAPK